MRFSRIAASVAFFPGENLQPLKMFPKRIPHQCGAVPASPLGRLIGSLQEPLIEDDLDYLHMLIILHNRLHISKILLNPISLRKLGQIGQYTKCLALRQPIYRKIPLVEGENRVQAVAGGQMNQRCVGELDTDVAILLHD